MLRKLASAMFVFSFLLFNSTAVRGAFTSDDSNVRIVPKIAAFDTFGEDMVGMDVTVIFDGGADQETVTWGTDAAPGGLAVGTKNWMLENRNTGGDHTFQSPWKLTYTGGHGNITDITLHGFAAFDNGAPVDEAVAFDRDRFDSGAPIPFPGTMGSAQGKNLQSFSFNVDVHYRDPVDSQEDGVGIARDLYGTMDIALKGPITPKFQQRPLDQRGENVWSDIDWRLSQQTFVPQAVADDFISDGRPITAIRWWGSYFDTANEPKKDPDTGGYIPTEEEGFLLSFFDKDAANGIPDNLAGSYLAPIDNVVVEPTGMIGWDEHRIWQYEVALENTFLHHAGPLATPESFNEEAGVEYWLSVAAESGHKIDPVTGEEEDTGEGVDRQFWGWHTSPEQHTFFANNIPHAADVFMPGDDWEYEQWRQIDLVHGGENMAFELLTTNPDGVLDGTNVSEFVFRQDADNPENPIPEPAGATLAWIALVVAGLLAGRRQV